MTISQHARIRMQQRGINEGGIELLVNYGEHQYKNGADIYFASKRACQLMLSEGLRPSKVGRLSDVYLVLIGQTVATVAHKH